MKKIISTLWIILSVMFMLVLFINFIEILSCNTHSNPSYSEYNLINNFIEFMNRG